MAAVQPTATSTATGTGTGPAGTCMPTIGLTGTTGIGVTKQIAAEGDYLSTNPVIGEFACLFVEARGGLPHLCLP